MPLSRRQLLGLLWPDPAAPPPAAPPVPEDWLPPYCRPPGASAQRFAELCTRCGDCIEACPESVLLKLGPAYGDLEGTPALLPEGGPCRLCAGLPCAAACETGALAPVPIDSVAIGTARWSADSCWAANGQPCDYCATACPLPEPAIAIADGAVRVDPDRCVGCGLCAYFCTATPKAIAIEAR